MKSYLITTAVVFGLITLAHVWRIVEENRRLIADPVFMILTILSAALCVWSLFLLRRSRSER